MPKLVIDEQLVASLVKETAPLVSQLTGWNLGIPALQVHVLPRDQGFEAIVEQKFHLLGLSGNPHRDLITRAAESLVENNTLAAYEPLANQLMVIRENVDDSNMDGLRLVIGHELTHRGQHVNHPLLFERINKLLVSVITGMETGRVGLLQVQTYFEQVRPLMTLVESHASYVQGQLKERYYPQAKIEERLTLPVLLFRLLGFGKTAQYSDGLPQVTEAMRVGRIDLLFRGQAGV